MKGLGKESFNVDGYQTCCSKNSRETEPLYGALTCIPCPKRFFMF